MSKHAAPVCKEKTRASARTRASHTAIAAVHATHLQRSGGPAIPAHLLGITKQVAQASSTA
jgi:hypothetical protein